MYLVGQGHEHLGPGTSMVQRIDWTQDQESQLLGLGTVGGAPEFFGDCRSMGGSCAEGPGLGCACQKRECGMGLFESGLDPSSWGWPEWLVIGLGGYVVTSVFFTGRRAVRQVREGVSSRVRSGRRRLAKKVAGSSRRSKI